MKAISKALSQLLLVLAGALVIVGLVALVAFVGRHPAASAKVLGALLVAVLVLGIVVRRLAPRVKRGTIIELDLPDAPVEAGSGSKLDAFKPNKSLTLHDLTDTLERASRDKRVAGLIVRPRFYEAPSTVIDELRAAIVAFGESGKFTVAVADSYDGNAAYAVAAACQQVTLQESGQLGLSPLASPGNFYPDLLKRAGVEMEVFGRGKYKSAPNRFTERKFTAADREQRQRLLDNVWDHVATQIGEARKLSADVVRKLADDGPLLASEALAEGLVDRVAYPDQVVADAKERVGKKATLLYLPLYKKRAGKGRRPGKTVDVAVIRAVGTIERTESLVPIPGLSSGPSLSPDKLVPQIRAAIKDKKVKAVVLRIDSPGGSALASDTIWRELVLLREAGKPLVASMASVAASGGYYIAAPANRIVAAPTTITGSIGVFGMRPVIGGAKDKLDIHTDVVHTGSEPPVSLDRKSTPKQKKRTDVQIDEVYAQFLDRVAKGRDMQTDAVLEVAGGRVWTGADAVEAGLVDDLGGLDKAIEVAVELSGAAAGTRAKVRPFPKKSNALGALRRKKGENSEEPAAASVSLDLSRTLARLTGVVAHLGCDPREFWIR